MSWLKENGLTIVSIGLAAISAAIGIKQKDTSIRKAVEKHFQEENKNNTDKEDE